MGQVSGAASPTWQFCGRSFEAGELEIIRQIVASDPQQSRTALSRAVCAALNWSKPDGRPKEVSCRVALLRMASQGLLVLPPARRTMPRFNPAFLHPAAVAGTPVEGHRGQLTALRLVIVQAPSQAGLWNSLMVRHHPQGYQPLAGAQLRYLIYDSTRLLGGLGFGAAAWALAPRDQFIGWTAAQRQARLHLVVNQARFLLLPWVRVKNLASSVLAMAARRLPADWQARHGFQPVLIETFVERPRFTGTCYAAANWICVGQSQGRGKLDRHTRRDKPIKDIWVLPLHRRFRAVLTGGGPGAAAP